MMNAPRREPDPFPLWGVLALPGGAIFGALLGIFAGALFGIPGIGATKRERYGDAFLDVIRNDG